MAVAYESRSITIFKSQFKRGFKGGPNQSCMVPYESGRKERCLRLYMKFIYYVVAWQKDCRY